MKTIQQVSYQGSQDLRIQSVKEPTLTPLSAIVRTKFTPVLPYDWLTEEGKLQQIRPVQLPITIGYGFAGIVERVGLLRDKNLIGKRVIGTNPAGANSELINSMLPPLLFEVPANVSLAAAATIIGGADAAYYAVRKINATSHDTVLITGASGGVGVYLIQFLKRIGATVIALGHSTNRDFLSQLGADYVINYENDLSIQLKELPTVNKVIDTVGSLTLLNQITTHFNELQLLSLSRPHYSPARPTQKFYFGQGNIGLNDYKRILTLLETKQLISVIQQVFDYQAVIQAQLASKNQHSHGRILLSYDQS
ncbi:zinc-binding dehydrogenase [Lactiplantibacillus sp. WILCCON 0030]|uniref:Zinc-binding dehydrogenase n=1 Tax=Lactiplantibacillus brownii TaxID=3069269 RepID=A0ABU1A8P3_9LACO|nr:zinc-binding dehydrogenase [Lactiplantibacillus brownii]MDQ7937301.1 zinc-binding dehydrogenase [Lactiplantibacillus brownii]